MSIGIDRIGMATPAFYVDLIELAKARGDEPDKYTIGIGQDQQAVAPSSQDIVTMGADAAASILSENDHIGLIALGTESGIDASKAGALYIQKLLNLSPWARAVEIKEACYGGTAALMMARDFVAAHPDQQALVIASDIARYGLKTGGEVTQGAGAVAMIVSKDPHILTINDDSVYRSDSIMDFWRPVYQDTALAKGKYSTAQYLDFFQQVWDRYKATTGKTLADFKALCFHLPYTKMGLKALRLALPEGDAAKQADLMAHFDRSIQYSRRVGNLYTGSLYLGLLSMLDLDDSLHAGDTLGLFSYGSGAVGEFFSATLVDGFEQYLHAAQHAALLDDRKQLSVPEYEAVFNDKVPYAAGDYQADPQYFAGRFVLTGVKDQERQYLAR